MVDTIEHGTIASVHYTGTFAEGGEFDSSRGKDPLVFLVGYGQMITGFEREMQLSLIHISEPTRPY